MDAQSATSGIWSGRRRILIVALPLIVAATVGLSLFLSGVFSGTQAKLPDVSVYFCIKTSPNPVCEQNGPATQAEKDALRQRLEAMPQVQAVQYESQAEEYQVFRAEFASEPDLVNDVPADGIPDSFKITLRNPRRDYRAVASAINGAPGVDSVVNGTDTPQ
jgi:cell division transport system permease protein